MATDHTLSLDNFLLDTSTSDATLRELLRVPPTTETHIRSHLTTERAPRSPRSPGEEEALEWHEVIELQAFSERKTWIEEKIKFLEQLPPIQVFVGLDAVRASALDVPGLPTREQLQQWMEEHDRIEKETETFDSGEFKKLKKFTKAATQRNLSPADTDLIELTLTTMYEFDKLVHLLRDRSDNLELLGIRLTWEERRKVSWTELRSLVTELREFLETRARWSPSVYERYEEDDIESPTTDRLTLPQPMLRRRGSAVSLASAASDSTIPSLGISRGERFKISERLSRDAAQFASRSSSLRHTKIATAGKALDHLIDESRAPVPDELLDEQDKLEDKGINEMEDTGKFVMNVVMQWKKADEIYVETVKDKNTAQTLVEEIEIAKLHHPSARRDASFLSRFAALSKRLDMRVNPALASSHFPRPRHVLFSDQEKANEEIVQTLVSELDSTRSHVKELETVVKEYHAMYEAVKKVETISKASTALTAQLESLVARLETGMCGDEEDGLSPNLDTEACLKQSSHQVYLALLPDVMDQLRKVESEADELLLSARRALADLRFPGIDDEFIASSTKAIDRLAVLCASASTTRDIALSRVDVLSQVRRIWATMAEVFDRVNAIREDIRDAIQQNTWKSESEVDAAILTPESPASVLPSADATPVDVSQKLESLTSTLHHDVVSPLETISPSVGQTLRDYLTQCANGLKVALDDARRMANICAIVKRQSSEMDIVREDKERLQLRIEDLKIRCEGLAEEVLAGRFTTSEQFADSFAACDAEAKQLREETNAFQESLPRRVPFVAPSDRAATTISATQTQRFPVISGLNLEIVRQAASASIPIDLLALDRSVRSDSNRFSIQLAGEVGGLVKALDYFRLCAVAQNVDKLLFSASTMLHEARQATDFLHQPIDEASTHRRTVEELAELSAQIDQIAKDHAPKVLSSCKVLRDQLHLLNTLVRGTDHPPITNLATHRKPPVEDVYAQVEAWRERIEVLSERVTDLRLLEQARILEEQRAREEERLRAEAVERAERERLEAEKQAVEEAEARMRSDAERVRTELEKAERERVALEVAEAECMLVEQQAATFNDAEDVFGMDGLPNEGSIMSPDLSDLRSLIASLRKRLQSININELAQPDTRGTTSLPTHEAATKLDESFSTLLDEVNTLPESAPESAAVDSDLRSLRSEVQSASDLLRRVHRLAVLATSIQRCDNALSDLLEHIDSYPAPPSGPLSSIHDSDIRLPPEDQMSARLAFTKNLVDDVTLGTTELPYDVRVASETQRISQTWEELQAMGLDRVVGHKSRPPSAVSTGRTSRNAPTPAPGPVRGPKRPSFGGRPSISKPPSNSKFLAPPPPPRARRTSSANSTGSHSRSSSRASNTSTQRSVSGPITISLTNTSSRLYSSTFASRQRSSSAASNVATSTDKRGTPTLPPLPPLPPTPQPVGTRPRARTNQNMPSRVASPTLSESRSRSSLNMSRSSVGSVAKSTWSRAPRQSFPNVPKPSPPASKPLTEERKPYVPNPKNKLDVAVGDVVNKLPVSINIEVVADTWKDQSGKYWIGDEDPKLCFCRILRSQTVMVRVGGGWTELSKFIKEHFADAFRLIPESPTRTGAREEKWISSATLQQASIQEIMLSPPLHPTTPEPDAVFIPSFALSTPSGTSPKSLKSSSPGSPLQPIQFIRRADRESPMLRTDTPTKIRPSTVAHTPKQSTWRP